MTGQSDDVPTTLRLLDPRLAASIGQTASAPALRRFAAACARFALDATQVHDATLDKAVALAESLSGVGVQQPTDETAEVDKDAVNPLRRSVAQLVEQLDTAAFDAQEAFEPHGTTSGAGRGWRDIDMADAAAAAHAWYDRAFAQARAATAVLRALDPVALVAAVEACYEAFHATGNAEALVAVAECTLHDDDMREVPQHLGGGG